MSCPDCFKGFPLDGEPTGVIVPEFDGAYFVASPSGSPSRVAVLLLTDIFGLPLKNSKLLADSLARELECDVWAPQLFYGGPFVRTEQLEPHMPERPGTLNSTWAKFWLWFKLYLTLLPVLPAFVRNQPPKVVPRVAEFINKLKAEKKYEKLGAVGYCFGGTLAVLLGGTDLVNSIVVCHPGPFTATSLSAIKVPNSWACAEEDFSFPPVKRLEAEAEFAGREGKDNFVEYEFKDWKGTTHGFACRPNLSIPEIKSAFEGCFAQTVAWFRKTIIPT